MSLRQDLLILIPQLALPDVDARFEVGDLGVVLEVDVVDLCFGEDEKAGAAGEGEGLRWGRGAGRREGRRGVLAGKDREGHCPLEMVRVRLQSVIVEGI